MTTTDDSTLEPKPKKGTRRSRRKSCTDVKVQLTSYTNAFISPISDYLGDVGSDISAEEAVNSDYEAIWFE